MGVNQDGHSLRVGQLVQAGVTILWGAGGETTG